MTDSTWGHALCSITGTPNSLRQGFDEWLKSIGVEPILHQGLTNQLIVPEPGLGSHSGPVRRLERLGGLLRYFYRDCSISRRCYSTIRAVTGPKPSPAS